MGKTKLTLRREAEDLEKKVTEAEETAPVQEEAPDSTSKAVGADTELEEEILSIGDKKTALLRLSVELQKELFDLEQVHSYTSPQRNPLWRRAADTLGNRGVITVETAEAILEFRNVRNRVIHGSDRLPKAAMVSAIDSGLRLVRLLRACPRPVANISEINLPLLDASNRPVKNSGVRLFVVEPDGSSLKKIAIAGLPYDVGDTVWPKWDTRHSYPGLHFKNMDTGETEDVIKFPLIGEKFSAE